MSHFEKVSREQFQSDMKVLFNDAFNIEEIDEIYDNIKLPTRSTPGSAGYDFKAPYDFCLAPEEIHTFPTGIKWVGDHNLVLMIVPRSGHGFRTGARLMNTVGIIDADYCQAKNEGHIMVRMLGGVAPLSIKAGQGLCQGLLIPFCVTDNDNENSMRTRTGGFGSTDAS